MDETSRKMPTPTQCRRYLRKAVTAEFEELVEGFLKEARKGSCAHMKLAIEVLRPETRTGTVTGKGVMQRLMEEMEREDAEQAAGLAMQPDLVSLAAVGQQVSRFC